LINWEEWLRSDICSNLTNIHGYRKF
jgi:hypothetical protein